MNGTQVIVASLLLCSGAFAQSIKIGERDRSAPDELRGYRACVPSQADRECGFAFGYSIDGTKVVVVLAELKRRLASGQGEFQVVDVLGVPEQLVASLRIHCRYRSVVDYALLAAVEFTGEPNRWVGPAKWAVAVDPKSKQIVHRDPAFVECYFESSVE